MASSKQGLSKLMEAMWVRERSRTLRGTAQVDGALTQMSDRFRGRRRTATGPKASVSMAKSGRCHDRGLRRLKSVARERLDSARSYANTGRHQALRIFVQS